MRILLWLVIILLVIALLIPPILSTSLGPWIISKVAPPIEVESLSLRWLSPQVIEGIRYNKPDVQVNIEKITIDQSLPSLLLGTFFSSPLSLRAENGHVVSHGVSLDHIEFELQSKEGISRLPFKLTGLTSSENGDGTVFATGVLSHTNGYFMPISLDVSIDKFPLATLDGLLEKPLLVKAFGPTLSVSGKLNEGSYALQIDAERLRGGGTSTLELDWNPDPTFLEGLGATHLSFNTETLTFTLEAALNKPLSFLGPSVTLKGNNHQVDVIAQNLEMSPVFFTLGEKITLDKPIRGKIQNFSFEIEKGSVGTPLLSSLAVIGQASGSLELQDANLSNLEFHFDKEDGGPLLLYGDTLVTANDPLMDSLLGGKGKLIFSAQGFSSTENALEFDPFSFEFTSPLLKGDGHITLESTGVIEASNPITLNYLLTPENLAKLNSDLPILQEPSKLLLEVSLSQPFQMNLLESWNFQTTLTTSSLKFEGFSIEDLISSIDLDGKTSKILATIEGKTKSRGFRSSGISLDLLMESWRSGNELSFDQIKHKLSLSLSNFPTALIPQAKELLGPQISLQLDSSGTLDEAHGTATVDSSQARGKLSWRWDDQTTSLSSPRFEIDIPPAFFEPLLEPVKVVFEINQLTIPKDSLFQGSGNGTIESDRAILLTKEKGEKITIPGLQGTWSLGKEGIHFGLTSSNEGISLNGNLRTKMPFPEKWSLGDFSTTLFLRGVEIPAGLFSLLPDLARLEPLLTPNFNIDLDLKLNQGEGTVTSSIISKSGTLLLEGIFHEGWFFLSHPLELSFQMTPRVGAGLLGELVPLISSGVKGRSPIRVAIDERGFMLPLNPFNLQDLEIGKAVIELDQLDVYPTEELGDLLSILGVQTSPGKSETLWFTPLYISYKDGVATLKRVDILLSDRLPIALWGKVDLLKNRVNLEVGLGAKTLQQAFGMKGLPKDYILPLALRGPLDSPSIDKPKATAKIGALLAQMEGSPQGLLIGGVLDLISGGLLSEGVPPPTTKPLPWETEEEQQQEAHPTSPLKKIFKGVEKGAKSLLKKVL